MRYYRKVIRIRAEDSPNVRLALAQMAAGRQPTGEVILPGVLTWDDYKKRRATWDKVRQTIGLDAEFPKDASVLLFPPDWLNEAEAKARQLEAETKVGKIARRAKAMGVDPAEGGDKTCWAIIDERGLIHMESRKTPDTSVIADWTVGLMNEHRLKAEDVVFDAGGGGFQHADYLRRRDVNVRTVRFGESATKDVQRYNAAYQSFEDRVEQREDKYVYANRRAEMYGELSQMLDPKANERGFGIPAEYEELRRQLALMPKHYSEEGRLYLPPKNKKDPNSNKKTLTEIIGHSPDEADALVLAVHALLHPVKRAKVGAA